jgi:hypothetical protein
MGKWVIECPEASGEEVRRKHRKLLQELIQARPNNGKKFCLHCFLDSFALSDALAVVTLLKE